MTVNIDDTARDIADRYLHSVDLEVKLGLAAEIREAMRDSMYDGAEQMQEAASEKALETAGKAVQDIMQLDPGDVLDHDQEDDDDG